MPDNSVARARAARSLAAGSTKAAAAREAGVDPGTITKWSKQPEFQDLILRASDPADDLQGQAIQGMQDLVPLALRTLHDALTGAADVSTQQQTVALNIWKAARQFEPKSGDSGGPSTLAAAIAEIEQSGVRSND